MKRIAFLAAGMSLASSACAEFKIGQEVFAQAEILDARAQPGLDGRATILLTLSEEASKRLAALTTHSVGQPVPITLDGDVLASPIVAEPVPGPTFAVTGSFSIAQADALAIRISGKPPLPDSLEDQF